MLLGQEVSSFSAGEHQAILTKSTISQRQEADEQLPLQQTHINQIYHHD